MAEKTTTKKRTTAKRTSTSNTGFTADERAAMKERAKELKAEAAKADGEKALREKIDELKGAEKAMATRLHEVVMAADPTLAPKTWYGMPAWAKDGQLLCFFQPAAKFDARYATFGFNDVAKLDQGAMWPTSWAIKQLTPAEEKKITALVKKAGR